MITFFVGTPGSGKSYEAVKKIVDNLKLGRTVCTNIDGMEQQECQEYLKNILGMDDYTFRQRFRILNNDQIKQFWKKETIINLVHRHDQVNDVFEDFESVTDEFICPLGSLIILDEAHKFFNARDWNGKAEEKGELPLIRQLGDWASTHRHQGYDLIFITQNIEKVDKQIRSLTEWTYFFRKVNFFGGAVQKKYLSYSYSGDDHSGKPLSKNVRTYLPQYFPCYKSYSSADAKEVGFMSHTNILKHPVFYAIPIVLCICLYMFFQKSSFASGDIFGVNKVQHKFDNVTTKGMTQTAAKPVSPGVQPEVKAAAPPGVPVAAAPGSGSPSAVLPDYQRYKVDGFVRVLDSGLKNGADSQTDSATYVLSGKTYSLPSMSQFKNGSSSFVGDSDHIFIMINGITVRLPSPYVQKFWKETGYAIADSAYFGAIQAPRAVPSPHPVSSSAPGLEMISQVVK